MLTMQNLMVKPDLVIFGDERSIFNYKFMILYEFILYNLYESPISNKESDNLF